MALSLKSLFQKEELTPEERQKRNLVVHRERCPQNHACPSVRVCPVSALHQKGFQAPVVDEKACVKCGKCVRFCPMGALILE